MNSGPRPCLVDVGFPLSGPRVRTSTSDLKRHAQHTADLRSAPTATPARALPPARNRPQHRSPAEHQHHPHIQHANLGVTSIYLQGIDQSEIIDTVYRRPAPMLPASTALH